MNLKEKRKGSKKFWDKIILFKNGKINKTQVYKELSDFYFMMDEVPKVYCAVTNNRISKVNTYAFEVISEFEENNYDKGIIQSDVKDMIKNCDSLEELKSELKDYFEL